MLQFKGYHYLGGVICVVISQYFRQILRLRLQAVLTGFVTFHWKRLQEKPTSPSQKLHCDNFVLWPSLKNWISSSWNNTKQQPNVVTKELQRSWESNPIQTFISLLALIIETSPINIYAFLYGLFTHKASLLFSLFHSAMRMAQFSFRSACLTVVVKKHTVYSWYLVYC